MEFMPIQKDMHIAVDDIICNELSNEGQKKHGQEQLHWNAMNI